MEAPSTLLIIGLVVFMALLVAGLFWWSRRKSAAQADSKSARTEPPRNETIQARALRDPAAAASTLQDGTVADEFSLNTATREQLAAIPGTGQTLAARIVGHREEKGLFETWEEVETVQGIGESTVQELKAHIKLGAPSTAGPRE